MKQWKLWKKLIALLGGILIIVCLAFGIYVSDYYHALDYAIPAMNDGTEQLIADYENFTIYGDSTKGAGFIFYPGGKVEAKAYEPLMYELSNKGICCVLVKMPCNLAVFDMNAADEIMKEISTIDTWFIGGHSLGGAMAASYAAKHSQELSGLVLLGAYATEKLPDTFPVLCMYGSEDGVLNRKNYEAAKEYANTFKEVVIEGGNHAYFGNYGEQTGDGSAKITADEQWNTTKETIADWMSGLNEVN